MLLFRCATRGPAQLMPEASRARTQFNCKHNLFVDFAAHLFCIDILFLTLYLQTQDNIAKVGAEIFRSIGRAVPHGQGSRSKRQIDPEAAIDGLARLEGVARPQAYFDAFPAPELAHSHVFFYLSMVALRRDRMLTQAFRPHGVRVNEWRVLYVLAMRPNVTMSELAETAIFDPTTLTRAIDQMARQGWVKRTPDPHDMRVIRVALLPAGSDLF